MELKTALEINAKFLGPKSFGTHQEELARYDVPLVKSVSNLFACLYRPTSLRCHFHTLPSSFCLLLLSSSFSFI